MASPVYPVAPKLNHVDTYHDREVPDPYRWLEQETSPERAAWIAAQRAATEQYLSQLPLRQALRQRCEQLLQYPRYYDLVRKGEYLFFRSNSGHQNQLVVRAQRNTGTSAEVLIDPTELASDGTAAVTWFVPSREAKYLAYGVSYSGSDWYHCLIMEMATRRHFPEILRWLKMSTVAWLGEGFYYSRFPEPCDPASALTARNENHQVWYHRVGTSQSVDTLVYEDNAHPLRLHITQTTEDERYVILSIREAGAAHTANALWYIDPAVGDSVFRPIVPSIRDSLRVVGNIGERLLVVTDRAAPRCRLVLIDPARPDEANWRGVLPEAESRLDHVAQVGEKLIVVYQREAAHELAIFDQSGAFETTPPLPGLGCVQVFGGERSDADVIWSFTNSTTPRTIYRYDIDTRAISTLVQPAAPFESEAYVTTHAFCRSKDGTRVPMFLVHRKGLALDGSHPSLLLCYGGNSVAMMPAFDPLLIALLEYDVVYAVACLRGGGEYGETWHHAGWREHKQNVFDDCIAAEEWLQEKGYTSSERAALAGSSNGGLTVGAVMLQRPELFRVALLEGAVLDMLRYQEFTVGWAWTVEYGSSEDPGMFPILLRYSPLHNIKKDVGYPATLVTVSEHDDRVVPAHSFKFIATLQELGAGPNPYLIRIDAKSGHGPVSLPKLVDERVDLYAFLLRHTGVQAPTMPVDHLDSSAPRVAATPIESFLRPS